MATQRQPYYPSDNYRQYSGLNSGINMLGNDSISQGISSMMDSMQQVQATEYADEQERQAKFKNLIDVSMKDVRGQWRDEAVIKKEGFLNDATKLAAESQGRLSWEQEKQLMVKKEGLEQFAGMSAEVTDWYQKATMTAAQIDDPASRDATMANITEVMEKEGLEEVHKATQDPNWLVQKNYRMEDGIALIKPVSRKDNGEPDIEAMEVQAQGYLDSGHPAFTAQKEFYETKVDHNQYKSFANWWAVRASSGMNPRPIDELQYIDKTKASKPIVHVMKVQQNDNGDVVFNDYEDGGVDVGAVTVDGIAYKNGKIVKMTHNDKGEPVWVATHSIANEAITEYKAAKERGFLAGAKKRNPDASDAKIAKIAQDDYDRWVRYDLEKLIAGRKDQTIEVESELDYEQYKNLVGRHIEPIPNAKYAESQVPKYNVGGTFYNEDEIYDLAVKNEEAKRAADSDYVMKTEEEINARVAEYTGVPRKKAVKTPTPSSVLAKKNSE
jgi:hypothetical protein